MSRMVAVVLPDGMRVTYQGASEDPASLVVDGVWRGTDECGAEVVVNGRHVSRAWVADETEPEGEATR